MNQLFFALIRVALGTETRLPHTPSPKEWKELYRMAKKQSLLGICFAGVQRLQSQDQCPPEEVYDRWMGMSATIQMRNRVVNRQCAELSKRMEAEGYRYCILKGQGVAQLYDVNDNVNPDDTPSDNLNVDLNPKIGLIQNLCMLRQSGDIDVWVQGKSIEELVEYVKKLGISYKATAAHVECPMYPDTDVELHAEPAFMRCFWTNRRLKAWFQEVSRGSKFKDLGFKTQEVTGFNVPSIEFNLVYMMVHMYHHILYEGLGLRQVMDYYFVLKARNKDNASTSSVQAHNDEDNLIKTLTSLGMLKFAQGIMWIIAHVFANGNDNLSLGIEQNEKVGRLLLDEIMTGGNFGHHDEKNKELHGGTAVGRSLNGVKRNLKFFVLGPWEILCSPIWSTWHWCWRKRRGLI